MATSGESDGQPNDDRNYVLTMLARAGLQPDDAEVDAFVRGFPVTRAMLESLYAVPGLRYEEPAIRFDPRVGR